MWKKNLLGGGGVDPIRQGPEADPVAVELFGEVDEVLHGAAEAVEFPDDKGVAVTEMLERFRESRAVGAGAADRVVEDAFAAGSEEGLVLQGGVLVGGGDAGVADEHEGLSDSWKSWLRSDTRILFRELFLRIRFA